MCSNPLLEFSWWGLALQLAGAFVVTGFVAAALVTLSLGRGVLQSEIAGGRRRDRRTRRDDSSNSVAYNRASHLAPDPDIHANPLPAHPAEEGVRVGEAPAF